ncbi:MarR family winged helix-turn-helix transcriptional regulator [Maricaulis sp. MIT060901]|uniref:MarR family winged helix-turn-helix transcriptional regulator n=1 Tax=Maricaulis sp. MIT060901 TaxID=3096993 RepID=UPI00399AB49A
MTDTQITPPAILSLEDYWPYQMVVLADRISRSTAAVVKEHADLNLSQWRVLAAIAEKPGRTAVEVVQMTPMDKGIVSRATKALLDLGLVKRQASQADGRVSHLYMTRKGERLYQDVLPRVESVPAEAQAELSPGDRANLLAMLRKLKAVLPDPQ